MCSRVNAIMGKGSNIALLALFACFQLAKSAIPVLTADANGNFNISAPGAIALDGNAINLTGNLSLTGEATFGTVQINGNVAIDGSLSTGTLQASSIAVAGFLSVATDVSIINVNSLSGLISAWTMLQGQPLSAPVTIQLADGPYDITALPNNVLLFSNQPFAAFITIQGNQNYTNLVQFTGATVFSNVKQLTVRYVSWACSSGASSSFPAVTLMAGASVKFSQISINGQCGLGDPGLFGTGSWCSANNWCGQSIISVPYEELPIQFLPFASVFERPTLHLDTAIISNAGEGISCIDSVCTLLNVTVSSLDHGMNFVRAKAYISRGLIEAVSVCIVVGDQSWVKIVSTTLQSSSHGFLIEGFGVVEADSSLTISNVGTVFLVYPTGAVSSGAIASGSFCTIFVTQYVGSWVNTSSSIQTNTNCACGSVSC